MCDPSLEGRPLRCTGRFVLRFFLLAAASQSVLAQPVVTPTWGPNALAAANCDAKFSSRSLRAI